MVQFLQVEAALKVGDKLSVSSVTSSEGVRTAKVSANCTTIVGYGPKGASTAQKEIEVTIHLRFACTYNRYLV